jgi:RNA polymerase sigma-70 factor (ECF subfamily)
VETSDAILLAKIAAGDKAAFAEFYDRHSSRIYGLAMKLLKQAREADDVLQDIFWQVWTRADQFDARRGSPLAWLVLLARSRCLDALRRNSRRRVTTLNEEMDEPAEGADFAESVADAELAAHARQAMALLPEEQRVALQLAFFGGLSHQEIAEKLNAALGTVKTRIRLGMQKLRELLVGAEGPVFSPEL